MQRLTRLVLAAVALGVLAGAQESGPAGSAAEGRRLQGDRRGDLQGAIALYKQIVSNAAAPRQVAAAALLGLGGCYEKVGEAEARGAYQRLIANYPEQTSEVAARRARLAALARSAEPKKPTWRQNPHSHEAPENRQRQAVSGRPDAGVHRGRQSVDSARSWQERPEHRRRSHSLTRADARLDSANICIEWSTDGKWIGFLVRSADRQTLGPGALRHPGCRRHTETRAGQVGALGWRGHTLRYALSAGADVLYFAAGIEMKDLRIYSMATVAAIPGPSQPPSPGSPPSRRTARGLPT